MDFTILKAAHHLHHRIHFANVAEELVAHAFALRGTRHQPAMSTNSTAAGMISAEFSIAASGLSRASGTITTPTLGSIVQNG